MDSPNASVAAEIERIAGLPAPERAAALEVLEAQLRAELETIPGA